MRKEHEKIIKYILHGVDNTFIILELSKLTLNDDFIKTVEKLISLQRESDDLKDTDNKMIRLIQKYDAIDDKLKNENLTDEEKALCESMCAAMVDTMNKQLNFIKSKGDSDNE